MEVIREYLPLLIPFVIAQLVLGITALIHVIKHPHYRFGNRVMWILIVLLGQMIGPIIYFIFGRGEEQCMCFLSMNYQKVLALKRS